jgi:hypothetical protein
MRFRIYPWLNSLCALLWLFFLALDSKLSALNLFPIRAIRFIRGSYGGRPDLPGK